MKKILTVISIGAILGSAPFVILEAKRYFNPRYEELRFDVHKESQSYRDGMVRRLNNLQLEYVKASPEHKQTIKSIIEHETADMDLNDLPSDLQRFINNL